MHKSAQTDKGIPTYPLLNVINRGYKNNESLIGFSSEQTHYNNNLKQDIHPITIYEYYSTKVQKDTWYIMTCSLIYLLKQLSMHL